MFDVHKYLLDGTVKREKIAMDIKYREIGTEELNVIVNDPDIKAAFLATVTQIRLRWIGGQKSI